MALIEAIDWVLSKSLLIALGIPVLLYFIAQTLEPSVDKSEPPAIRSPIPIIGYFIRSIREQSSFLTNVGDENRVPIATLPVLNKKLYAIWDPYLVQSAYCSKNLSFVPFAINGVRAVTGYDEASHKIVSETNILPEYFKSIYEGTTAQHIHQLNVTSLRHVSQHINGIGKDGFVAPNIYLWLRDLMTVATCEALFGPNNPIRSQELVEDIWTFETGLPLLMFPFHIIPPAMLKGTKDARKRIQDALAKYCSTMDTDDEEVSAYIRNRVAILRKYGIEGQRVGDIEVALIHVPTSNSIPTIFWFFIYVFTNPDLVLRLRAEVEPIAERGPGDEVTLNVDALNDKCPLLISCFRETSRLANKFVCRRRVVEDTTVTDRNGRSYLLKKGGSVQMPSGALHASDTTWGKDVEEFRPDRFLDTGLTNDVNKSRRISHTPFGGGAHMCPGRNFASAEIISFVASMLVGYHVEPLDGNWNKFKPPRMAQCPMVTAVCKPVDENNMFGARVTRRSGWESAKWKFNSGKLEA